LACCRRRRRRRSGGGSSSAGRRSWTRINILGRPRGFWGWVGLVGISKSRRSNAVWSRGGGGGH
jgi:hypothetical protein